MDVFLSISAFLLVIVGIIGCIVPAVPGQFFSYGALLCCYFCSYSDISSSTIWIFLVLTIVVTVLDFLLPAYFAKLFGGSKAGERGATAGLIVGMLLGNVIGAIIGPFIGAIVGELIKDSSDVGRAVKVGVGSFLSFLVGTGFKVILSLVILIKIVTVVFPAIGDWFSNIF